MRFHVLAKPTGSRCNLACAYCFYLPKASLYPDASFRMSDAVMERFVRQLLEAHPDGEVELAWQGGEPTLMGLPFFERAVACAETWRRPDQRLVHTIQTNGLLIDDAWAHFLAEHHFLVGLSIDGPRAMHEAYRRKKGGGGTHETVVRAWRVLRRHRVEVNALCTIHAANADHPLEVYRFFRDELEAKFIQLIPIVEHSGDGVTERSVRPEQFGRFLIAIFDQWIRRDVGRIFVQTFDAALGNWIGRPTLCIFAERCGTSVALEHNGDLYACDHFVDPAYRLGNIDERPLAELMDLTAIRRFGQEKLAGLPRMCRECPVRFACNGECPRNRFVRTPDGEEGLNYLCAGYGAFFRHIDAPMRAMAALIASGRPASAIMRS